MKRDFPANELRPFRSMKFLYGKGRYQAYGLFLQDELLAYACFALLEHQGMRCGLFGYLAVLPEYRDSGVGGRFFGLLPEEKRTRERRMSFYLRHGCLDTGVNVRLFGVDYRLMEAPVSGAHDPATLRTLYAAMYRSFFRSRFFGRRCISMNSDQAGMPGMVHSRLKHSAVNYLA